MAEISTERLIMRGWRESDLAPWAAMNADPEVRRYLGPLLTFEQASAWVLNLRDDLDRYGFGFWALEVRASGAFIGFTGLRTLDEEMPFTGVELGWLLARPAWGHGYATEAALAAMQYGFDIIGLPEIVGIATAGNLRSQAVMRRIGMTSDPAEDFDDPDVDQDSLRRHVVYRKRRVSDGAADDRASPRRRHQRTTGRAR
jgi:RimJ/RimL family protein N-acetyltransferase